MNSSLVLALLVVTAPAWGQQAPVSATTARASTDASTLKSTPDRPNGRNDEGNVKFSVIEDEGSKIEELRVRGQIQRIVVTPKVGLKKSYEILTGDPSHLPADGTGGAPDATGKRVWNVLNF